MVKGENIRYIATLLPATPATVLIQGHEAPCVCIVPRIAMRLYINHLGRLIELSSLPKKKKCGA